MLEMNNRYRQLLLKYAGDKELYELLDLVALDDRRVKEIHYSKFETYPENRDLLGKLTVDLQTVKEYMDNH